ncbi:MAG: lamin tail domain-containing protein, partial [Anaerohalosphaera sp.]|nr:lamin tail domain-containing protein [Anaerohalosphaera sp.]
LSQNGEYLALVESDGVTIISDFTPEFPEQRGIMSYGTGSNGIISYLLTPTLGQSNSAAYAGVVADTKFSLDRGFFEAGQVFDVAITSDTSGSVIRYTLDGSTPTLSNGNNYSTPIHIDSTTCLRGAAFKTNWLATDVDTQTYIFLDDVIAQSPNGETPSGWPTSNVNGQVFDYGMDPDIVNHAEYGPQMLQAMKQIPSISLVTDMDNLVGSTNGIYVNATLEGIMWERPTSVELINPDGSEGFQANAGLRIRGAYSRTDSNPKHSFRLLFKGGYGPGELDFPMFGEEGVKKFDNIDLRTAQNYAWSNWGNDGSRNTLIRDVYSRDLQREMGRPYTRSRYYHLYLNGQYWGMYQSQERSEASYAASYFGGYDEYYDVIKTDSYHTSYTDGSLDKWNELWYLCENGLNTDAEYYSLLGKDANGNVDPSMEVHVDVDNLIDYMLDIFFAGNQDAPITLSGTSANNFYAIRNRKSESRHGWQFFAYDSEHSMLSTGIDRTGWFSAGSAIEHFNPQWLHQKMMVHSEYRMRFADQAQKYFFNDGAMTTEKAVAVCLKRASEIDFAIIGESARWGDQRSDRTYNPYTKVHWWNEVSGFLVNTFLSGRTQTVLNQLKNRDLYPQVQAPTFNQHGGQVADNFEVTMSAPAGTIYYTLDGCDPRLWGGAISPSAQSYNPASGTQSMLISAGATWKYLDDGSDQGTAWRGVSYNDNLWVSGPAELGYGDGGEQTTVGYVDIDPDQDGLQCNATTYFRTSFNVSNASLVNSLNLSLLRDDGAAVYLNGTEVARDNMPTGSIDYQTFASNVVGGGDESVFYDLGSVETNLLVDGMNVLAVEIHQNNANSSDISFDLELTATISSGDIVLDRSTEIKSRVLDGSTWSTLNEATFAVGPVADDLRITEIMYHPAVDPNSEFIELKNIGTGSINLNLVKFTNGVDFTFPAVDLAAGEHILIVKNTAAFNAQCPTFSGTIAGEFIGALDNDGDRVRLEDAIGTTIHDFKFKDGWYDITDGGGFTLTVSDPATATLYEEKDTWRASTNSGGSPGADDIGPNAGDIVINELLAHSDAWPDDWIELYNASGTEINIGGWYLSDNNDDDPNLMKYRIADGTTIAAAGYLVFTQDEHFGDLSDAGCLIPFALSENGEKACITSAAAGILTGYRETEDFGASEVGISLGRYYKASTDSYNFVAMSSATPDSANAYPKVGPIVISEIMYNPAAGGTYDNDEYEFVELYNVSGSTVTLEEYDAELGVMTAWKFTDGIDYIFDLGTTIDAGQRLVIARNIDAFAERYGYSAGVLGPFANDTKLSNGGERLQLAMPGDTDADDIRQYIRIDRVTYSDGSHPDDGTDPWPSEADGNGKSLVRKILTDYGNDVANWKAE